MTQPDGGPTPGRGPTRLAAALRDAMEVLAIQYHLDNSDSLPDDREPPGEYVYEGKAWWELPEEAKQYYRGLVELVHPTWVSALAGAPPETPREEPEAITLLARRVFDRPAQGEGPETHKHESERDRETHLPC